MTAALVDVIVPSLGESPYVADAIASVFCQTLVQWALRVSLSVDRMAVKPAIDDYLEDPRVDLLVPERRMTMAENFNRGVRAGAAKYVALLHDDDRWRPEFLERNVHFLEDHPSCGFAFSPAVLIDEEGVCVGRQQLWRPEGVYAPGAILPELFRRNFITAPSVVMRRSAYEAIADGFRELLFLDHELWLQLASRFDVGYIASWQTEYRIHASQTSATSRGAFGHARLELLDTVDTLPVSSRTRRRMRALAHVTCVLDHTESGERRLALGHMVSAFRTYPPVIAEPGVAGRIAAALGAGAAGESAMRRLGHVRRRRRQRGGVVP